MKVGILCSGVALGVYIPGISIHRQLRNRNWESEVFVLENLLLEEKKNKLPENKEAFHKNFALALAGQKLARDIVPSLDRERILEIFEIWIKERISYFIVVSGFWMSIIEIFREMFPDIGIFVECLHIDSDFSPSWKKALKNRDEANNVWLFSHDEKRIVRELRVTGKAPLPYDRRENRFLIHGGGWGMGTYQGKIPILREHGINLDIIAYDVREVPSNPGNDRYFMVDPDWHPWLKNENNQHVYPPFARIIPGSKPVFESKDEYPDLFDITRAVKAVISKPGGSTLIDSLSSATPIVMLEPFGEHEKKNAELWIGLGFAVSFDDWERSGFDFGLLRQLHVNLLDARGRHEDYIHYLENVLKVQNIDKQDIVG
ncbi:MAG: UDP-glucuronosyltransferase [Oligoflexales bacterium]|nr:UDP-glucuronosyltransferase [Oligoflexales bacterium]